MDTPESTDTFVELVITSFTLEELCGDSTQHPTKSPPDFIPVEGERAEGLNTHGLCIIA
ncbi:hypothetical protein AMATHDRAFT_64517 [Amanita thiersii Skay4041]|uniref:Pheromone n=1 Tax=Amanita thiersii Skay4041 TaxID=703135 RepID=A0A2A9NM89_9AGAR|nr:hypothetical protein AMATHDRAFT_64517 [Amanita thiersii Skay4041]